MFSDCFWLAILEASPNGLKYFSTCRRMGNLIYEKGIRERAHVL